jgi:hypothetical protein
MRKFVVLAAAAASVAALAIPTLSVGASSPKLVVIAGMGPDKSVPPLEVSTARATCPKGYVAIAGQEGLGALDLVYSDKLSPRTWEVALGNPDPDKSYKGNAGAVCAKGKSRLTVKSASRDQRQALIASWKASHR